MPQDMTTYLMGFTNPQLESIADSLGIEASGKKAELVNTIISEAPNDDAIMSAVDDVIGLNEDLDASTSSFEPGQRVAFTKDGDDLLGELLDAGDAEGMWRVRVDGTGDRVYISEDDIQG